MSNERAQKSIQGGFTMMKLCYAPSSCATVSHLVLEEAGALYELRRIDLAKGEQRTEDYLKINPNGRVPALILDDGRVLIENIGILTYVARLHPAAELIPTDRGRRVKVLQ